MKAKVFVALQTVFLGLGMLVFIPTANPTATGKPGSPLPSNVENDPLSTTDTTTRTAVTDPRPRCTPPPPCFGFSPQAFRRSGDVQGGQPALYLRGPQSR